MSYWIEEIISSFLIEGEGIDEGEVAQAVHQALEGRLPKEKDKCVLEHGYGELHKEMEIEFNAYNQAITDVKKALSQGEEERDEIQKETSSN